MFRIALCDDSKTFLEYEKHLIQRHLNKNSIVCQCDDFLSGEELLAQGESIKKYDLIILDYAMDGLTGFDTANKIYEVYPNARIAFATNYYDFTREGYKYNAVRYLVKKTGTFESDLEECLEFILKTEPKKKILLELSDSTADVDIDDILYIESSKHYIEYFIKEQETRHYVRRCILDDAQEELPEYFGRVHQRYIVNLKNATVLSRHVLTIRIKDGETREIPVARNRYEEVKGKFYLIKGGMIV